jgi:hypothetical protein
LSGCRVRAQGTTDPPQDCDYPFCGCDLPFFERLDHIDAIVDEANREEGDSAPEEER